MGELGLVYNTFALTLHKLFLVNNKKCGHAILVAPSHAYCKNMLLSRMGLEILQARFPYVATYIMNHNEVQNVTLLQRMLTIILIL